MLTVMGLVIASSLGATGCIEQFPSDCTAQGVCFVYPQENLAVDVRKAEILLEVFIPAFAETYGVPQETVVWALEGVPIYTYNKLLPCKLPRKDGKKGYRDTYCLGLTYATRIALFLNSRCLSDTALTHELTHWVGRLTLGEVGLDGNHSTPDIWGAGGFVNRVDNAVRGEICDAD